MPRTVLEGAALFVALLALLALASRDVGLTWDESLYFQFSNSILNWLSTEDPLDEATIAEHWAYSTYHNPHPPFMKIASAATARALHGTLPFPLDYRFGHLAYAAACLALVYGLLRTTYPAASALLAVLFVLLQPRVFGEMTIATTDAPVALAWLVLPLVAWRIVESEDAKERGRMRALLFVVYGFAVATKFTGLLAAAPLGAWFLLRWRPREIVWLAGAVVWALVFLVVVSPEKWSAPFAGVVEYLTYPFTRSSTPISTIYFGDTYAFYLPWHYFAVMSLVTYPVVLGLLLPGLALRGARRQEVLVPVLLAVAFWLVLVHLPNTPRHDGVRQFVSVYPLIGILSWLGLRGLLGLLEGRRLARGLAAAGAPAVLALGLLTSHPHELSYYNQVIGGIRGAERAGMEMSYYFESVTPKMIESINESVGPGQNLYMTPYWPHLIRFYQATGLLRDDFVLLPDETTEIPDFFLILRRRSIVDDEWYRAQETVYEVKYDGVSLAKLARANLR